MFREPAAGFKRLEPMIAFVGNASLCSIFCEPLESSMEGADSFNERSKAVTGAPVVTRPVRLIVYSYTGQYDNGKRIEEMIKILTKLSGLEVEKAGLFRKKLYAYFDDRGSAIKAALAIIHISYCRTSILTGTFDVTHLAREPSTGTPLGLKQQAQLSRMQSLKDTKFFIDVIGRFKIENCGKYIKSIIIMLIDYISKD